MSNLTYEDFVFPNFINSHPAIEIKVQTGIIDPETGTPIAEKVVLPFDDAPKISVFTGVPFLNIGDTRCGKSRMMRGIAQSSASLRMTISSAVAPLVGYASSRQKIRIKKTKKIKESISSSCPFFLEPSLLGRRCLCR